MKKLRPCSCISHHRWSRETSSIYTSTARMADTTGKVKMLIEWKCIGIQVHRYRTKLCCSKDLTVSTGTGRVIITRYAERKANVIFISLQSILSGSFPLQLILLFISVYYFLRKFVQYLL